MSEYFKLGVIGAGGHGKVVADTAERAGWSDVVFFDPRFGATEQTHSHWQLLGLPEEAQAHNCDGYFVAIGNSLARQQWNEWLLGRGLPLVSLIDPDASVSQYSMLESGVLVVAGAVINADTHIARGVIVNTRAAIDHDCTIAAYSHVCPGAALAGTVSVGEHSWLGIGCQVRQGARIGSRVTVAAGATVVSDIEDGLTVLGTPARSR